MLTKSVYSSLTGIRVCVLVQNCRRGCRVRTRRWKAWRRARSASSDRSTCSSCLAVTSLRARSAQRPWEHAPCAGSRWRAQCACSLTVTMMTTRWRTSEMSGDLQVAHDSACRAVEEGGRISMQPPSVVTMDSTSYSLKVAGFYCCKSCSRIVLLIYTLFDSFWLCSSKKKGRKKVFSWRICRAGKKTDWVSGKRLGWGRGQVRSGWGL